MLEDVVAMQLETYEDKVVKSSEVHILKPQLSIHFTVLIHNTAVF